MDNEIRLLEDELAGIVLGDVEDAKLGTGAALEIAKMIADTSISAAEKKKKPGDKKEDKKPTPSGDTSFLTKRAGPLPVYGWIGVGIGGLGAIWLLSKLMKKGRRR